MIKLEQDIYDAFNIDEQSKLLGEKKRVFNTIFEMQLRIILLMAAGHELRFSSTRILTLDFINYYAKSFDIALEDLHGNNDFMYAELTGRRTLVVEAIKKLVRQRILDVKVEQGYQYKITGYGLEIAKKFHSTYALEYHRVAELSVKKYEDKSDEEILQEIQQHPIVKSKG